MLLAMGVTMTVLFAAPSGSEALLRQVIGETVVAQVRGLSPDWEPAQRDCAGLVRYAYRRAFARLQPGRLPLWQDGSGRPVSFANAATLIRDNFMSLGRDDHARAGLRSGDLLAFRQDNTGLEEPTYHLMVAVVSGRSVWVVYHPGEPQAAVRWGALNDLESTAPAVWKPTPVNPAFLGYLRFKEWAHGDT